MDCVTQRSPKEIIKEQLHWNVYLVYLSWYYNHNVIVDNGYILWDPVWQVHYVKKKQKTTVWISEKQINKIKFFKFAHNKVRFGPPDVSSKK